MKKRVTLSITLVILISLFTLGQEEFTWNQNGISPEYVVIDLDSIDQKNLYNNTINWIKVTYKNPDEVIKMTIQNEKVRFEGFQDNLICTNSLGLTNCYYALYTIEIGFKNNKYKFTPIKLEYKVPSSQYSAGGLISILNDGSNYFNKKGIIRKMYSTIPSSIESLFNELNSNLANYLTAETENNESDDW